MRWNFRFIMLLIAFSPIISQAQLPNSFPTSGLVAYYPFNGNANDASGNNNNGIVHGAKLVPDRFGNYNNAYEFNIGDGDTSDYIDIPNNSTLEPSSSISISAWVWISDSATQNFQRMISKNYSPHPQNYSSYQLIAGNEGQDSLGYPGLTILTSNGYNWTGHSGSSFINQWVNICGTWDGSNMRFYQNGILTATVPEAGNILYDTEDLWIAKGLQPVGNQPYSEYFKGYIDDVGIWNRAISDSEINEVFNYTGGCVGINTTTPARNLDINNTLRIEPRNSAPSNPSAGDIYFDSTLKMLRVFDGTQWQNCW